MKKVRHQPSKRFLEAKSLVDRKKYYPIAEAIELAKKTSTVKFDAGLEVHLRSVSYTHLTLPTIYSV